MAAHLYRIIQNISTGGTLAGATVSICNPGTTTAITDGLFTDRACSVPIANPFVSDSGVVDIYLVNPQTVAMHAVYGSRSVTVDDLDVLPPVDELLSNGGMNAGNTSTFDAIAIVSTFGSDSGSSALADGGIAIGGGATVETGATNAIAIGTLAEAAQSDSISIGDTATTAGIGSVTIGSGAVNSAGARTVAIGMNAVANDALSIAIGGGDTGSGAQADLASVAIGVGANATGNECIAIGVGVLASGAQAVGINSQVTGDYSIGIGYGTHASHAGSVAIGVDANADSPHTAAANDFLLGTALHNVKVPGQVALGKLGLGAATPVGPQTRPVTLADVIALLQTFGLSQ